MSFPGDQADSCVPLRVASEQSSVARIADACRYAAVGKLAVRDIGAWLQGDVVSEPEFRLLWLLSRQGEGEGREALDQAQLAERLVVSPAQVSGAVERLRRAVLLERVETTGDRRRQRWQVTQSGEQLLSRIVARVAGLPLNREAA